MSGGAEVEDQNPTNKEQSNALPGAEKSDQILENYKEIVSLPDELFKWPYQQDQTQEESLPMDSSDEEFEKQF